MIALVAMLELEWHLNWNSTTYVTFPLGLCSINVYHLFPVSADSTCL